MVCSSSVAGVELLVSTEGGNTIGIPLPLTAPTAIPSGARLGVSQVPVFRVSALALPKPGGMRAAFLLMSSFFRAPPSAVCTTSTEVGLP